MVVLPRTTKHLRQSWRGRWRAWDTVIPKPVKAWVSGITPDNANRNAADDTKKVYKLTRPTLYHSGHHKEQTPTNDAVRRRTPTSTDRPYTRWTLRTLRTLLYFWPNDAVHRPYPYPWSPNTPWTTDGCHSVVLCHSVHRLVKIGNSGQYRQFRPA